MALRFVILLACIVAACGWRTRIQEKGPENNPLMNTQRLGKMQDAWKSLEKAVNQTYVLVFRSRNHEPNISCVYLRASNLNETNKTANYTRTYYNMTAETNMTVHFPVRALKQEDYESENVVRAGLKGQVPSETPVPPGSYEYVEYGNYSCNSSSTPFSDAVRLVSRRQGSNGERVEGVDYLDFYVVYNQPSCNVLKSPLLGGACDFWVPESELKKALGEKKKTPKVKASSRQDREDPEDDQSEVEAFFKKLPAPCRAAFITSCGYPNFLMYNKTICNKAGPAAV